MALFSHFFKQKTESSEFLYYTTDKGKVDTKIHDHILQKGMSEEMGNMAISRLRARTGVSLEDAKVILGMT